MATTLRRRRICVWSGCRDRPSERGEAGMCAAHAAARHAQDLATAYAAFAEQLERLAVCAGRWPETEPPAPPGRIELLQLAQQCRRMASTKRFELSERRRREFPVPDPAAAQHWTVETGLLELWPGRPSTHTAVSQADWSRLRAALAILTPAERRAYMLIHWRGLHQRAAARRMHISPGSLYNLLERAEERLRAWRREQ